MRPQPTAPERQSWSSQAGVVVGDACGEQSTLPLDGRRLEAFELVEDLKHAVFAGELRLGREVLPAEQPAHVDGGSDRLDLLAQGGEGEAMDALQDAALAPFDVMVRMLVAEFAAIGGCSKAPRMRSPCISIARKAWKTGAGSRCRRCAKRDGGGRTEYL